MFFIFEMANNHMGSVEHGKRIIDEFSSLAKKYKINAGVKLQFRQLDTFIHKDYKNSDLKYVKRFNETRLSEAQFRTLVEYIKDSGLEAVATPFDNDSIQMLDDLDIDVVKIASCSIDDWPLLEEVSKINKKIIISTAGADLDVLREVYRMFTSRQRDFSFLHCVAEYPTPVSHANLKRIKFLMNEFSDIDIGFSTHESPSDKSLVPFAVAMGCKVVEKHVGIKTDEWGINAYSCTPEQMELVFKEIERLGLSTYGSASDSKEDGKWGIRWGEAEKKTLTSLKRGAYVNKDLAPGDTISNKDLYYAMPVQDGQFNASDLHALAGATVSDLRVSKDGALMRDNVILATDESVIEDIKNQVNEILESANVSITKEDSTKLSAHYGLKNFANTGCVIIDKINREYCKKLIIQLPGQSHPFHHHVKKEEAFELLHGDCKLNMNGTDVQLQPGKPIIIDRGVVHSFSTENGCVVEEVSTTHYLDDSRYQDPTISKLKLSERKINIKLV